MTSASAVKRRRPKESRGVPEQPPEDEKWRKILYCRQPFPDNYSGGEEFLKELKTNVNLVQYTFKDAFCGAAVLISQINVVVLFVLAFEFISEGFLSSEALLRLLLASSVLTYSAFLFFGPGFEFDHVYTLATLVGFGYGLTPVIRTLTDTIDTDTIYVMSFLLFMLSLVFHDFGMDAPIVNRHFSANLSLAASVCLISRVPNNQTAFLLLALSILLFSYWPMLRNLLNAHLSRTFSPCSLLIFAPLVLGSLSRISLPLVVVHVIVHVAVLFICPQLFVRMQKYKSTIHGPWDEATPQTRSHRVFSR